MFHINITYPPLSLLASCLLNVEKIRRERERERESRCSARLRDREGEIGNNKLHPPHNNLYDCITLIQQVIKHAK